jgi:hypothetical protein
MTVIYKLDKPLRAYLSSQARWVTPVIPATQEAEIQKTAARIEGKPGKK